MGSFFCIATKFFGGEADTVHKAIGGVSDAAHGHERSAFNSLASASAAARQQTSEPVHPRNRTERSENGRRSVSPSRLITSHESNIPFALYMTLVSTHILPSLIAYVSTKLPRQSETHRGKVVLSGNFHPSFARRRKEGRKRRDNNDNPHESGAKKCAARRVLTLCHFLGSGRPLPLSSPPILVKIPISMLEDD